MAEFSFFLKNRRDGFTRMEVLVVVIILGLLAIVPIINFRNAEGGRRDARRKADLRQTFNALEAYYNQNGSYPLSDKGRIKSCTCGSNKPEACQWGQNSGGPKEFCDEYNIVYLKEILSDPTGKTDFCYYSNGNLFRFYAKLEIDTDFEAFPNLETRECNQINYNFGVSSPNTSPLSK